MHTGTANTEFNYAFIPAETRVANLNRTVFTWSLITLFQTDNINAFAFYKLLSRQVAITEDLGQARWNFGPVTWPISSDPVKITRGIYIWGLECVARTWNLFKSLSMKSPLKNACTIIFCGICTLSKYGLHYMLIVSRGYVADVLWNRTQIKKIESKSFSLIKMLWKTLNPVFFGKVFCARGVLILNETISSFVTFDQF